MPLADLNTANLQMGEEAKLGHHDPVRIGLVGCGRLAEFGYLPAFKQAKEIKLAGVADINQSRCKEIAPGVPAHQNIHALIDADGIDALVISTPTRFHLSDARSAANAGLPALLEKPPGLNLDEARALYGLRPCPWIGFNRRFDPDITRLKYESPRDGDIQLELHYRRTSWNPFDMQDDALLDLAPHLVDLARWLTGSEILSVRAVSLNERRVNLDLKLERGHAAISCSNDTHYRERIVLKDLQGRICGSYKRGGLVSGVAARLRPKAESPLVKPIVGQLEAFALAVRGMVDWTPLATSADGLAVMTVIDAARRSATQSGVECRLPPAAELVEEHS
jgi:predicted dehydrogenase